jgi:hypothetical protein
VIPFWWSRDIREGDVGGDVRTVQRILGMVPTGEFKADTAMAVRGLQHDCGLAVTGEVDEMTARRIGPRTTDSLMPEWYKGTPLFPGQPAYDLVVSDESWLRRLQGNHHMPPTGVIDEATALMLGAMEVG